MPETININLDDVASNTDLQAEVAARQSADNALANQLQQLEQQIDNHEARTDNPHGVTAAQIGVQPGATANSTDAQLRDRATHTGTQPYTTITGLGDAATKNTGTAAGTVAAGNDSRLADTRFQRALAKDINTYSSTSTTSEELLAAIPVGAGIVIPGDFLEAVALVTMPTNGNNKNFRIYISPTASFSDPNKVLVAFAGPFTNTTPSVYFRRKLIVVSDTVVKIWIPPSTNYYNDDQTNTNAVTAAYTIPSLTAGFYFLVSSQKGVAGDMTRLETFVCELIR